MIIFVLGLLLGGAAVYVLIDQGVIKK